MSDMDISSDQTKALTEFLKTKRWFAGKARRIKSLRVQDSVSLPPPLEAFCFLLVRVDYVDGGFETYSVPVSNVPTLSDALSDAGFLQTLLNVMENGRQVRGDVGSVIGSGSPALSAMLKNLSRPLATLPALSEQSHSTVFYADRLALKFFRKLESGENLELEVGRFLTQQPGMARVPRILGALEYQVKGSEPMSLALLQEFIPSQGDGWQHAIKFLDSYYVQAEGIKDFAIPSGPFFDFLDREPTSKESALLGRYPAQAALLGERTAELHLAFSGIKEPSFVPEPFTEVYRRSLCSALQGQTIEVLRILKQRKGLLPVQVQRLADDLLKIENHILKRYQLLLDCPLTAQRIRVHGDFHLGQTLFTGNDFVTIDFEGEPDKPLAERRAKCSALKDVAGMFRSFHYAGCSVTFNRTPGAGQGLKKWQELWTRWACVYFFKGYSARAGNAAFLPQKFSEVKLLLEIYLLDKAVYELGYELKHRPDWAEIPLRGILQMMES